MIALVLAELRHSGQLEDLLVCCLIALIVGALVWAAGTYLFHQAWAGVAGFLAFLIVLALCVL